MQLVLVYGTSSEGRIKSFKLIKQKCVCIDIRFLKWCGGKNCLDDILTNVVSLFIFFLNNNRSKEAKNANPY